MAAFLASCAALAVLVWACRRPARKSYRAWRDWPESKQRLDEQMRQLCREHGALW